MPLTFRWRHVFCRVSPDLTFESRGVSCCETGRVFIQWVTYACCSLLFTGFVTTSTVVLYCAYWCLYIFHLLLHVLFPVWSNAVYNSPHSTKIHIIEVISVFIVGTLPYVVFAASSNYTITSFPPTSCTGDSVYSFYSLIIPTVILSCCSLIMMLIILYSIHIVSDDTAM